MAEHRTGVAEAHVDVGMAVDVGDLGAAGLGREQRERPRPLDHPLHRHAADERSLGPHDGATRSWPAAKIASVKWVNIGFLWYFAFYAPQIEENPAGA